MAIAFIVNVYNDQHLAVRLIKQIRHHFEQTAFVIGDGVPIIPELDEIGHCFSFPRAKHKRNGYWTQRYLQMALQSSADTIIKLDPDTCIWKRFKTPNAEWFGTLSDCGRFVRGGACGFSRETAEKIVKSGLLYKDYPYVYYRYSKHRWPHEEESEEPLSNQDNILRIVMSKLGIKPTPWPEVLIYGNSGQIPSTKGFVATHPHPTL